MSRLFDTSQLMNENLEANATKRTPLPIGETTAQIMEATIKEGTSEKPGKPKTQWARLDCKLEITDPEYLKGVGDGTRDKAVTFLGVMLDLQDGRIATGADRNVRLGQLREAAGCNGKPLSALVGQYIRVQITQKPHPTEPVLPDGSPNILSEVSGFTKV